MKFLKKIILEDYLKELNSDQRKAVMQIQGSSMVIAGAGSGKTRVLTYKIAYLLKNNVNPFNILSLTFTNKAAKEMRDRIEDLVGGQKSRNLWMGTFHSIFSRILRIEAEKINFPQNFTIYDTADSKSLIKSIIKELSLDREIYKVTSIHNRISTLKNNFIIPSVYKSRNDLIESDKKSKRTEFSTIYHLYCQRCFKSSAMDFDDLLINMYKLLTEFPEILHKYQNKFQFILVDEYQDTNHIQYLIIKKLAALNENICVVGDDAQSIYSFRGANIENILNFKKDYPDYKLFKLEQNYRSTKNIVNIANALIKNNNKQIEKDVWTNNSEGKKILICETDTDNSEGKLVSNTIKSLAAEDNFNEFAILYRTNSQSRSFEESLRKLSIPYKIYGGLSFYQRKEVKDLLAYFRLSINPKDEESLKRIINYPSRGIGNTTLQKLIIAANNEDCTIWEIISNLDNIDINLNAGSKKKIKDFYTLIKSYQSDSADAYNHAENIVKTSGIFHLLYSDKTPEGVNRFENIQELLNGIKDFTKNQDDKIPLLSEFMEDVSLLTDTDNEKKEDYNKVTLMTIHASKGLEFPYIFVVGMEEGLFPSMMSVNSQEDLEEERRLCYVAITRAKKRLFLSYCNVRFRWGQYIDSEASRFLSELDERLIEYKSFSKKREFNKEPYNISNDKIEREKKKLIKKEFAKKNIELTKDLENLTAGQRVKHMQFGNGKILQIEGKGINKQAIVFFSGIGQKKLLLRFAKLEVIS